MSAQGNTDGKLHPLTVSSLYPSAALPEFGIFVENRLRHLANSGEIVPRVVAPVPWFPSGRARFGRYAAFARTPLLEERHGILIAHPRYPVLPKVGMSAQPLLLYAALRAYALRLLRSGARIDLIDAHYVYPDGVAAGLLARELRVPLVVTARGTDLNLVPRYRVPRRWIRWVIGSADRLVAVCEALAQVYRELGARPDKVRVLRNGVDLDLFTPGYKEAMRDRLKIDRPCLIVVGQLIERKGVDLSIRALPLLPEAVLLVVGDGPLRGQLEGLARQLRVSDRVRFAGQVAHAALPELYGLADALVLVGRLARVSVFLMGSSMAR